MNPGRAARRLSLGAAGVLLALAAIEAGLRVSWCGSSSASFEYQSKPFLSPNAYWGTWHFPNDRVEHRRSCFTAHYTTNEVGMKSGPIRAGARHVALLGDSFVEGFGLDNDKTAAHWLETELGPSYQVLNFGVSGYFSTIDELVLYDDFAKFFDPEIVILFFVNYNDLEDLLDPRKERLIDRNLHFVYPHVRDLREVTANLTAQRPPPLAERIETRSCLLRFLRFAGRGLLQRLEMAVRFRWDFRHELVRPYLAREDDDIRRAWTIVDASLGRLRDLTRERGAKLVVVDIADPYQLDPNWIRVASLREQVPLSPTHPNERLGAICKRLGIRYYDMYPEAEAYVRSHGLDYPFLSFRCDRHYDDEGQRLMAMLVFGYLEREGLLSQEAR